MIMNNKKRIYFNDNMYDFLNVIHNNSHINKKFYYFFTIDDNVFFGSSNIYLNLEEINNINNFIEEIYIDTENDYNDTISRLQILKKLDYRSKLQSERNGNIKVINNGYLNKILLEKNIFHKKHNIDIENNSDEIINKLKFFRRINMSKKIFNRSIHKISKYDTMRYLIHLLDIKPEKLDLDLITIKYYAKQQKPDNLKSIKYPKLINKNNDLKILILKYTNYANKDYKLAKKYLKRNLNNYYGRCELIKSDIKRFDGEIIKFKKFSEYRRCI